MINYAMAIAASMTLLPALLLLPSMRFSAFVLIMMGILLCWVCTELYIGITRPCQGTEPKQPLLMVSRMLWLCFVIYSWLDIRFQWSTAQLSPWLLALLLALCAAGLLLRIWAVVHLGKSFSYDVKKPESGMLITTGPYKFIRHPAYLGILMLGSLPGLILGSVPGFVGMLLTTLVPVLIRAKAEDDLLKAQFGERYLAYQQATCGLIPFIY